MKATSALLALGVCLAMFTPSARAEANAVQKWKLGHNNELKDYYGYVWNGAFRDAAVAALEAGDYAAFQALTNGFNETVSPNCYTKGWTGKIGRSQQATFTNAQEFFTFLYFDPKNTDWTGDNSVAIHYHLLELPVDREQVGNSQAFSSQSFADNNAVTGTVGAARTSGAALLIATDPIKLPRAGFTPAGMTGGLASNGTVECTAPAGIVFEDIHYSNSGASLETWNGTAWGDPKTVEPVAENGTNTYTYTHEAASTRLTWKYAADGFRPDIGPARPNTGSVTVSPDPNFTGLEDEGYYTNGTQLALTAVPVDAGFRFAKWVVNGEDAGSDTTHTVTMDQPLTVRAVFESIPLTWNGGDNGSWTNGGAGWLAADGTPTNWLNGATAVFTNPAAVTADIAAEGVTATAVRVQGAAVELTGGTLTMINDARLSAPAAARLTINATLAGTDGLRLANGIPVHEGFLTTENTLLFPDVSVAKIDSFIAQMGGKGMADQIPVDAGAYNVKRDETDGTVSVQFQVLQNGNLKCVKAVFSDGVDGIYARVEWAKLIEKRNTPPDPGYDFEMNSEGKTITDWNLATWPERDGYGLLNLTATVAATVAGDPGPFVIGVPTVFTGDLALDVGRVEFGEDGKLGADGKFAGAVTLAAGTVLATPPCTQTFNADVTGGGAVLADAGESAKAIFKKGAAWTGGLTVSNGASCEFCCGDKNTGCIPNNGEIMALSGGKIYVKAREWDRKEVVYIGPGCLLDLVASRAKVGECYPVILEGGMLNLRDKSNFFHSDGKDIVTNGGWITGAFPIKTEKSPTFTVCGNAPCYLEAGFAVASIDTQTFTMDVGDVTNGPDLIVSGPVSGGNNKAGNAPDTIVKTGAGTVVFSGQNTEWADITRIDEGTLRFETDQAMAANAPIVLNGAEGAVCTLDIGTNRNDVGTLTLTQKGGTLKLGEGGAIEFDESGALDWPEGAELWIDGTLGTNSVRFGTDTNGLNEVQLGKIKLVGESKPLHLDDAGWLCGSPKPPAGTVLILR